MGRISFKDGFMLVSGEVHSRRDDGEIQMQTIAIISTSSMEVDAIRRAFLQMFLYEKLRFQLFRIPGDESDLLLDEEGLLKYTLHRVHSVKQQFSEVSGAGFFVGFLHSKEYSKEDDILKFGCVVVEPRDGEATHAFTARFPDTEDFIEKHLTIVPPSPEAYEDAVVQALIPFVQQKFVF